MRVRQRTAWTGAEGPSPASGTPRGPGSHLLWTGDGHRACLALIMSRKRSFAPAAVAGSYSLEGGRLRARCGKGPFPVGPLSLVCGWPPSRYSLAGAPRRVCAPGSCLSQVLLRTPVMLGPATLAASPNSITSFKALFPNTVTSWGPGVRASMQEISGAQFSP